MEPYKTPVERARRRVIEAERRVTAQLDLITELARTLRGTADKWAALQGLCDQLRHERAELEQLMAVGEKKARPRSAMASQGGRSTC
ncbi:hypothetical protein [Azohydromonas aeria]|uniref:hypothetical protein n=1 Tax=Azohydromonas aeria TaxID=2590212 RepID=UPI0012F7FC57|nr:hypothetical protein [Azohydromonas aeria]